MKLKIGQQIVHRSHGIGKIVRIEPREFAPDNIQKFYVIEIQDCGATKNVFVPFENAAERLRGISDAGTIERAFDALNATPEIDGATWNTRYRLYMERVQSGDLVELAKVLRDLRAIQSKKDLSFGERKLLDQAEMLFNTELQLAGHSIPKAHGKLRLVK